MTHDILGARNPHTPLTAPLPREGGDGCRPKASRSRGAGVVAEIGKPLPHPPSSIPPACLPLSSAAGRIRRHKLLKVRRAIVVLHPLGKLPPVAHAPYHTIIADEIPISAIVVLWAVITCRVNIVSVTPINNKILSRECEMAVSSDAFNLDFLFVSSHNSNVFG